MDLGEWGLHHGTWAILRHLYPRANISVVQLSLELSQPIEFHFDLGKQLRFLREQGKGVLIIGSGNIVHNISQINWDTHSSPHAWASEFDMWVKNKLLGREYEDLLDIDNLGKAAKLSIPTIEHYLPLIYILGASDKMDKLYMDYEGIQNASMSMRCIRFSQDE